MAPVNAGKHRDEDDDAAARYGRHSRANAGGLTVTALLKRVMARGEAIRLAWRGTDSNGLVDQAAELPTAVLPVIREPDEASDDEDTEPTTATREARRWLQHQRFMWWPRESMEAG